jgi:uncharacterized membrane-anchored protein YjiN (DUF445 family)
MAVTLNQEDQLKLTQLWRVKMVATSALVTCFVVLIAARACASDVPALALVAAFAEAAMIGGLADWYAVVALFRHPLGLPIPHTAIIPSNQNRIAENLGSFIEENFLASEPVAQKLKDVDFAAAIVEWLSDRDRSRGMAKFFARIAPQILSAIDETGLKDFVAERVAKQLRTTDLSPMVMEVLGGITKQGQHQQLLDEIISALHKFLNNDDAVEAIRKRVSEELPSVLIVFRADEAILKRILKTASALLNEVKDDKDHELRHEFEDFFKKYIRRLKRSKSFVARIEKMKTQVLERPELAQVADQMWASLREFVVADSAAEESVIVSTLTDLFVDMANSLEAEPQLRHDINFGMVTTISTFVSAQKHNISAFMAEQVKSWDFEQLTLLIEANVGKDLQFIRFNGMIIGGIAGVILHLVTEYLF